MKPLGNERRHSLSRKDEKAQRKSVKAKGRQAARKELMSKAYPAIRHKIIDDPKWEWRHEKQISRIRTLEDTVSRLKKELKKS